MVIILLAYFKRNYWILGFGYMFHILEDGFFHTKMATSFLYPLWRGRIQKYSATEHKWVQFVDLILMLLANILISLYKIKLG